MRANFDWLSMWKKVKERRELILKGLLAVAIVSVLALDVWLGTCGFERCPSAREIQAYHPDEGGRVYDRSGQLMGRVVIVRDRGLEHRYYQLGEIPNRIELRAARPAPRNAK